MLQVKFGTQELKIDVINEEAVVICEHCNNPVPETYVPFGHKVFCSNYCIDAAKRWVDICEEFERASRIDL